ncbi:MAG: NAD(+) kinase, partial [Epsilonproteobacteria bacterium]|nr:NAD(+) kinase [Campylobacterota bacterium]
MIKEIKDYSTAGFVLKPNAPEIKDIFLKIKEEFEEFGIEVFLDNKSAKMIDMEGIKFSKMCKKCDFLVS